MEFIRGNAPNEGMVAIDSTVERRDGVTLVTAVVTNDRTTTQRVRLRSTLSAPVWPPRRNGVAAPEWTDDTWSSTLEPGVQHGIGFATAADPADPPIELLDASRATASDELADPRSILATLDESTPPRAATERGTPGHETTARETPENETVARETPKREIASHEPAERS